MTQDFKLVSANGSQISVIGEAEVEISIQGLVIPWTMYVVSSLSHNVILAQDFLQSTDAVIDCANRSLTLYDGLVRVSLTRNTDRDTFFRLTQDVIFPPRTEAIVKVHVPKRFINKTSLVETFAPIKNKFLLVAGALVHPTKGTTICRVINTGKTPRRLRAKTPIAQISSIDLNDPFNQAMLSLNLTEETHKPVDKTNMPPHAERQRFLEAKGLAFDNPNLTEEQFSDLTALLYEFQDIFCGPNEQLPVSKLPAYHIHLTDNQPVRQRRYPLSPKQEDLLEQYADKLLAEKVVQPSKSPFNAPALLVKKANFDSSKMDDISQFRLVLDFRKLNVKICNEFVPLTDISTVTRQISEVKPRFHSTFDWKSGFDQISLDEESRPLTAWSTKTRHLEYLKTPQGLRSSPWAFMQSIYDLFRPELRLNMAIYVDDSLIFHQDFDTHLSFLRKLFYKMRTANLRLNPRKSLFARESVSFLGFKLSSGTIQPDPKRYQKIRDLQPATNVKQVKMLLGYFSYYRRHIRNFSIISAPLRNLLRKDVEFCWSQEHDQALAELKDLLINHGTLHFPDMNKSFSIVTDASKSAAAHVLLQEKDGIQRMVSCGGRPFKHHESKLSATDLELLAILHAVETYHQFLSNGKKFKIFSDHCSLQFLQNLKFSKHAKYLRYSLLLQNFDYEIVHIRGRDNIAADILSRYPIKETEHETEQEQMDPDSIQNVDHFAYLNSLDVDQLIADSQMKTRDPLKKRKRNYKVYELAPIDTTNANDSTDTNQTSTRNNRSRNRRANNADGRNPQLNRMPTDGADIDGQSSDDQAQQITDLTNQVTTVVNLETQSDDQFIAAVIQFIQQGKLPNDRDLARRVTLQADDFFISNDQLFHLARLKSKKRLHMLTPRFQQLVIPKSLRLQVMQSIHEFSHYGFAKCHATARQKFYWHGMASDLQTFISSCCICQQINKTSTQHLPLHSIPVKGLFECLMIDFHEVRTEKQNRTDSYRYILILVDQFSQHVTLVPCKDMRATTAARSIMDHHILRFGCFRYLISDRSSSWLNDLFQAFLKMNHMQTFHLKTSPYRACTNSLSELQNKSIIKYLKAHCENKSNFWEFLPAISCAINSFSNGALGVSPYFVLYGQQFRFPFDTSLTDQEQSFRDTPIPQGLEGIAERLKILRSIIHENIKDARSDTERIKNKNAKPHDFQIGQRVFVSQELESNRLQNRKHSPNWCGPYYLLDLKGDLARVQHMYSGKILKNWINVSKLKRLRDESRQVLYNKYKPDAEMDEQPTVQTPIACTRARPRSPGRPNDLIDITQRCRQHTSVDRRTTDTHNSRLYEATPPSDRTLLPHSDGQLQAINSASSQLGRNHVFMPNGIPPRDSLPSPAMSQAMGTPHAPSYTAAVISTAQELDCGTCRQTPRLAPDSVTQQNSTLNSPNMVCSQPRRDALMPDVGNYSIQPANPAPTHVSSDGQSTALKRVEGHLASQDCLTHSENNRPLHIPPLAEAQRSEPAYHQAIAWLPQQHPSAPTLEQQQPHHSESHISQQPTQQHKLHSSTDDTQQECQSYTARTWQPSEAKYNFSIVRVSARKRSKPQSLFKAHFSTGAKPQWLTIEQIPPVVLANFYVRQFKRRQTNKSNNDKTPAKEATDQLSGNQTTTKSDSTPTH
jgi:hypothetical protein